MAVALAALCEPYLSTSAWPGLAAVLLLCSTQRGVLAIVLLCVCGAAAQAEDAEPTVPTEPTVALKDTPHGNILIGLLAVFAIGCWIACMWAVATDAVDYRYFRQQRGWDV